MQRVTISLCMIVKNEEKHLHKCLESVRDQVDEIIVVDTGSTDATMEIAARHQAKVLPFEWIHDFSAARNYSLAHATCEYILVLDADEFLEPGTDLQQDVANGMDYFLVRIKNYMAGGYTILHPAVRLFRRSIGLEYEGRIHEHLNIENPKFHLQSAFAATQIGHVGYLPIEYEEKNKHERNFELLYQAVKENPSGYNWFNLGMQLRTSERYLEALDAYKKAFSLSKDKPFLTSMLFHMGACLMSLKRYEDGMRLIQDSIHSFPHNTDLHFILGQLFLEAEYLEDAEICFKKCLELGDTTMFTQSMEGLGGHLSYFLLGVVEHKRGQRLDALEMFFRSMQMKKHYVPAVRQYLQAMQSANVPEDHVYQNLQQVYALQDTEDMAVLLGVLYGLRHSLLDHYLTSYNVQVESHVHAAAKQYAHQYDEAVPLWKAVQAPVKEENLPDLAVLALLVQEPELVSLARPALNVTHKEWQAIQRLVNQEPPGNFKRTAFVEKLLLDMARYAIVLQEFTLFEYLSQHLMSASKPTQYALGRILEEFGFYDVALELLVPHLETDASNPELIQLLGDLAVRKQMWQEALTFYERLLDLKKECLTYQKIYAVYQQLNDRAGMQATVAEAKKRFPLSIWAEQPDPVRNA